MATFGINNTGNSLKEYYEKRTELRPRHHNIIRLAFMGMKYKDIAEKVGITPVVVSCILSSSLAKRELAQLRAAQDTTIAQNVNRIAIQQELTEAAGEAVRQNRLIMNSDIADIKLKAKLGMHFMDRVIFDQNRDDDERQSFRDILRAINRVEKKVDGTVIEGKSEVVTAQPTFVNIESRDEPPMGKLG